MYQVQRQKKVEESRFRDLVWRTCVVSQSREET